MSERGDSFHVRRMLRAYWKPEAVESRRQAHQDIAAGIVAAVDCPACFAPAGAPCRGLSTGYHFARGEKYAKWGWPAKAIDKIAAT